MCFLSTDLVRGCGLVSTLACWAAYTHLNFQREERGPGKPLENDCAWQEPWRVSCSVCGDRRCAPRIPRRPELLPIALLRRQSTVDEPIWQLTNENSVGLVSLGLGAGVFSPAEGMRAPMGM